MIKQLTVYQVTTNMGHAMLCLSLWSGDNHHYSRKCTLENHSPNISVELHWQLFSAVQLNFCCPYSFFRLWYCKFVFQSYCQSFCNDNLKPYCQAFTIVHYHSVLIYIFVDRNSLLFSYKHIVGKIQRIRMFQVHSFKISTIFLDP